MRAGVFSQFIDILEKQTVQNEYGTDTTTYVKVRSTRASVDYVDGDREITNDEFFYSQRVNFTVHIYIPVEDEWHVLWNATEYRVLGVETKYENHEQVKVIKTEKINK